MFIRTFSQNVDVTRIFGSYISQKKKKKKKMRDCQRLHTPALAVTIGRTEEIKLPALAHC